MNHARMTPSQSIGEVVESPSQKQLGLQAAARSEIEDPPEIQRRS
jgi:hypothetical protein